MKLTLEQFNHLPVSEAQTELERCCGSRAWARKMLALRPFASLTAMCEAADRVWFSLSKSDWLEAFGHHPRIGEAALRARFASTAQWASQEQSGTAGASDEILSKLAAGNRAYEDRFGHVFLVCATGKSATEMLALLEARLKNSSEPELLVAAGEQSKITRIRLEKLLS